MIKAVGLDIVETKRMAEDLEEYGERFVDRILGPDEKALYAKRVDKHQFLAGRFAAKEAVIKGLGAYLENRPLYTELQILPDEKNMPSLVIPNGIKNNIGEFNCHLSITHEKNYAAAVAVFSEAL